MHFKKITHYYFLKYNLISFSFVYDERLQSNFRVPKITVYYIFNNFDELQQQKIVTNIKKAKSGLIGGSLLSPLS